MLFKHHVLLAAFGLQIAASAVPTAQNYTFNFNDMLDGSLGDMPAMWLVTHGSLAALNATAPLLIKRSKTLSAPATTLSTTPATRDKENGAVLGAFIGAALTAPIKFQDSNSKLEALCQTLVAGAAGMTGAVVGQEAGKSIYSTNSTAPNFEQGLVPGTFIGGIVGTATGTQLTRTLCDLAIPGFKELLADLDDLGLEAAKQIMRQSYLQAIDATLDALGVESARMVNFSGQVQQVLRFVHLQGPAEGVEQMTRALTRESAQLANAFADGAILTSPAVSALAGFSSLTGVALGLPPIAPPSVGGIPALGHLSAITSQLSNIVSFANTLPTISQPSQAQVATDALRDGIAQAAAEANPRLTERAKDSIRKANKLTTGLLDTLDHLRPRKVVCRGREHSTLKAVTQENTTTVHFTVRERITKTRTSKIVETSTITETTNVEASTVTVTATATPSTQTEDVYPPAQETSSWCERLLGRMLCPRYL